MGWWILSRIRNLWPFRSSKRDDDLRLSDSLVRSLPIPESTKQFVFALQDPDNSSVLYLLAAEKLSERSSRDVECLVRAVRPNLVVGQIDPSSLDDLREERNIIGVQSVPTSSFGVLKGCIFERINCSMYERRAGSQVLEIIFGTGFYGHVLAAKQAAIENQSLFLFLETPQKNGECNKSDARNQQCSDQNDRKACEQTSKSSGSSEESTMLSGEMDATSSMLNLNKLKLAGPVDIPALRALVSSVVSSLQNSLTLYAGSNYAASPAGIESGADDYIPSFAHPIYNLLTDFHEMFKDIPVIDKAFAYVRKMLADVEKGKEVDCQVLAQVSSFRIAVEGLRVALNSAARNPIKKEHKNPSDANFNELPYEEKCDILFAQALRQQARKFNTVVAIVDASSLAGIRRHWKTPLAPQVTALAEKCFISDSSDSEIEEDGSDNGGMFLDKPVVAFGAGAAALLGMSSFSKIVPVSTFMKIASFKVSGIMKFGLIQTKRTAALAMGKVFSPAKFLAPIAKGLIRGKLAHAPGTMKAAAAAGKIRATTHSVIAVAERTSFSAMRTAFYGIMQKRMGKATTGANPRITFGVSVFAFAGLLAFGDGIECAVESAPAAPTIARLGRGLENLKHASQVVCRMDSFQGWETIYNSMYNHQKSK